MTRANRFNFRAMHERKPERFTVEALYTPWVISDRVAFRNAWATLCDEGEGRA